MGNQKAQLEAQKIKDAQLEVQKERRLQRMEKQKSIKAFQRHRKQRQKILKMKNRKGQPNLNQQMNLLLHSIQNKNKRQKKRKMEQGSAEIENGYEFQEYAQPIDEPIDDGQESELDINDFLSG